MQRQPCSGRRKLSGNPGRLRRTAPPTELQPAGHPTAWLHLSLAAVARGHLNETTTTPMRPATLSSAGVAFRHDALPSRGITPLLRLQQITPKRALVAFGAAVGGSTSRYRTQRKRIGPASWFPIDQTASRSKVTCRPRPPGPGSRRSWPSAISATDRAIARREPQPLLFDLLPVKLLKGVDLHLLFRRHARALIGDLDPVARALAGAGDRHGLARMREPQGLAHDFRDRREESRRVSI